MSPVPPATGRLASMLATAVFALVLGACGPSALSEAANRGDLAAVRRLLDDGASDRAKNEALFDAVRGGSDATVSFLLDRGADVNTRDSRRSTPMMAIDGASREKAVALAKTVELLLARGAKPGVIDEIGRSPFSLFAQRSDVLALLCARSPGIPALRVESTSARFVRTGPEDAVLLLATRSLWRHGARDISAAVTHPAGHAALREALGLMPRDPLPRQEWIPPKLFAFAPGKHRLKLQAWEARGASTLEFDGTLELEMQAGVLYVVTPEISESVAGPSAQFKVIAVESCGQGVGAESHRQFAPSQN